MAKRGSGRGGDELAVLPITALQAELRRREGLVNRLRRQHARLIERAAKIEQQIRELGGLTGDEEGGRVRPRNDSNLTEALVKVLTGKTMAVTEAAEAVQRAGYRTTSPNFRTIVNQTLLKQEYFKRVGRGQYTAK